MREKDRRTHRQRALELTRRDRANRCAFCKLALGERVVQPFGLTDRYCSDDCLESAREVATLMGKELR